MVVARILRLAENGDYIGDVPADASAGAEDAGRVPVLGSDGTLHPSFLPRRAEHYVHTQDVPSTTWVVAHNLGKVPVLLVLDESSNVVEGDIRVNSPDQLTLQFSRELSGVAYCN